MLQEVICTGSLGYRYITRYESSYFIPQSNQLIEVWQCTDIPTSSCELNTRLMLHIMSQDSICLLFDGRFSHFQIV